MSAQGLSRAPLRMRAALIVLMTIGVLLGARLFYWQIVRWDDLSQRATDQRDYDTVLPARRGDILTSDGVLLANRLGADLLVTDSFNHRCARYQDGVFGYAWGKSGTGSGG